MDNSSTPNPEISIQQNPLPSSENIQKKPSRFSFLKSPLLITLYVITIMGIFGSAGKQVSEDDKSNLMESNTNGNTSPIQNSIGTPFPTKISTPSQIITPIYTPTPIPTSFYISPTQKSTSNNYFCDCSKTCSEISSCQEAQYLLNTCGCTRRDADGDGIACDAAPLHCQY